MPGWALIHNKMRVRSSVVERCYAKAEMRVQFPSDTFSMLHFQFQISDFKGSRGATGRHGRLKIDFMQVQILPRACFHFFLFSLTQEGELCAENDSAGHVSAVRDDARIAGRNQDAHGRVYS